MMCKKNTELKKHNAWKDKIAVMILVKQELQRLDSSGIWSHYLPEIAATEEQLMAAEVHLGHSIDKEYKDFLMCANGWKSFFQTVDLFGSEDLAGSSLMDYALEILAILDEQDVIESSGFSRSELLPIATTGEDKDLFVMSRATSHQPGIVIWFAGEEIERFSHFEEFFLAMIDYNRYLIADLENES